MGAWLALVMFGHLSADPEVVKYFPIYEECVRAAHTHNRGLFNTAKPSRGATYVCLSIRMDA
jgi:hypothetical protein